MNQALPIETRLLGLTPRGYQQLKGQARLEAGRLHTEAIGAAIESVVRQVARRIVRLRPRLEQRPVRAGLKPCQP